jgi:aminoglycoside 6'-N-acetyltransferase I
MQIRLIREDDRAEWVRMRGILWPDESGDHERETQKFFTQTSNSLATFVIDRLDGRLGGFIELGQRPYAEGCSGSPVPFIEGWYVDEDLRGQGWGAALVEAGEQWARDLGFTEIASDTEIENEASIKAHKALGYSEETRIVCFRKTL